MRSAGIVLYRQRPGGLQFLLVHPGGPYWANKDAGAWSVPKGEYRAEENALDAACREFEEEIGTRPRGDFVALTPVCQRGGKVVRAWGVEGDLDPGSVRSNTFSMEWPPGSGRTRDFPEVDRVGWFSLEQARTKINPAQLPLLEELTRKLEV